MARSSVRVHTGGIASRVFAPLSRDWARPGTLVRIIGESLLFVASALAISHWLSPEDPLGIAAAFPWIWLVPSVLALRYGTIDGVLGALLLLGWWFAAQPHGPGAAFPQQYFLGGAVLVFLCGQFADVWNNRLERIRGANHYLDERLNSLTRTHYLLRLSHQRLEQELLVRPVTLSDLLGELAPNTPVGTGELARGDELLRMLAGHCEIESASIHAFDQDRLRPDPVASIGDCGEFASADPLLAIALERAEFTHVRSIAASQYQSDYLVCAPIVASSGERLGMLLVRKLPFFALNEENLQFVAVILGYYADSVMSERTTRALRALRPDCPNAFALDLVRMKRLHSEARVVSSILALTFTRDERGRSLLDHIRRTHRGTDLSWEIEGENRIVMLILLPLAGHAALEGMLIRIEDSLRAQFDLGMSEARLGVHISAIAEPEVAWTLDDLLRRTGVEEQRMPAEPMSGNPAGGPVLPRRAAVAQPELAPDPETVEST